MNRISGLAEDDLDNVKTLVQSFATRVPRRIAEWRKRLRVTVRKASRQ